MSIVIGCDSFLSLRNVRNGDLAKYLKDLHILVDPNQLPGSRIACPKESVIGTLIDFDPHKDRCLSSSLYNTYLARKAFYNSSTIWGIMVAGSYRSHASSFLRRMVSLAAASLSFIKGWVGGAAGMAKSGRMKCAGILQQHPLAGQYRNLFRELKAEAVAGFSPEGLREMLLIEAANSCGIPTAVMIRSRDNLSVKIQHLPFANKYFVWSERLRRFLLHMYPETEPENVIVTGAPQFDHHLKPECRLSREKFFSLFNLDPGRPLIVYSMATPGLIGHEMEIVQHLADAVHNGRLVRKPQLLVRGHPRMFGSDIKLLKKEYPEVRSYPSPVPGAGFRSPEHEASVVRFIIEDEPVHLATLAYQSVQVNICGTMTIDSAILDKPTVNICYDLIRGVSYGSSVRRFYGRTDIREMMGYRASRIAYSPAECIRLINLYLDNPELDSAGRRRAREEDCGPLDGQAGKRIAESIQSLMSSGDR